MTDASPSKKLIIATRNKGKVREFAAMFEPLGYAVQSLDDYPAVPDIAETGDTFAANALIKARAVVEALGVPALADDSGLVVDALGGAPGVYSARYAGEPSDDAANNAKLLSELHKISATLAPAEDGRPALLSRARFVCALAYCEPLGRTLAAEGACEGAIAAEPRGGGGFGYDPYFFVPELNRTLAELATEEKNRISHRAQALRHLISIWED
jgi:XTP/dITP diphosphohydrolase